MQLNLNVFFLSFFSESVRKYISVKTHWYLYQFIDLQCKSIAGFYETGLCWTGFSSNYCLATENLDAQNTTTDE